MGADSALKAEAFLQVQAIRVKWGRAKGEVAGGGVTVSRPDGRSSARGFSDCEQLKHITACLRKTAHRDPSSLSGCLMKTLGALSQIKQVGSDGS